MAKKQYHTFKRCLRDAGPDDPKWEMVALAMPARSQVVIKLTADDIREAIRRNGQADTQNCAAAVCVVRHKNLFKHPVSGIVDWWRRRVYIAEPTNKRTKRTVCRVYAHYDDVEELFDTDAGLKKLLKRVEAKGGYMDITLYPITKGKHPKKGTKLPPSGPSGPSGKVRQPRRVGSDLRMFNYMQGKGMTA
jgi:hypothetical protein